jgi:hypothetical protein
MIRGKDIQDPMDLPKLEALNSQQMRPSLMTLNSSKRPPLNVIYCHFPLTHFDIILNREENTALVSDDYSVILIKQDGVIYSLIDDDGQNYAIVYDFYRKQPWSNYYTTRNAIRLIKQPMNGKLYLKKGDPLDIYRYETYDNVNTLAMHAACKIHAYTKLFFQNGAEPVGFWLTFDYTRAEHMEHEKMLVLKFFYLGMVTRFFDLPFMDILPLFFCGDNSVLWQLNDPYFSRSHPLRNEKEKSKDYGWVFGKESRVVAIDK